MDLLTKQYLGREQIRSHASTLTRSKSRTGRSHSRYGLRADDVVALACPTVTARVFIKC
jgi:hypothetical protein